MLGEIPRSSKVDLSPAQQFAKGVIGSDTYREFIESQPDSTGDGPSCPIKKLIHPEDLGRRNGRITTADLEELVGHRPSELGFEDLQDLIDVDPSALHTNSPLASTRHPHIPYHADLTMGVA